MTAAPTKFYVCESRLLSFFITEISFKHFSAAKVVILEILGFHLSIENSMKWRHICVPLLSVMNYTM